MVHVFRLFEKELRTYSGDDPLDVWFRFVLDVVELIQSSDHYINFVLSVLCAISHFTV